MSHLGAETTERLQDAFMITMDQKTAALHNAAVAEAIRSADVPLSAPVSRWRLRIPALLGAVMVVLPVGAAVAADSANPGDMLYPIKKVVEPLVSIFDSDVVASHRVEELEHIIDAPADVDRIPAAVSDARDAVSDLPPGHVLRGKFERISDRVTDRSPEEVTTDVVEHDVPPVDQPPPDPETDVVKPPGDRPENDATTTTVERDTADHTTTTQGAQERPPAEDPPPTDSTLPHVEGDGHPRHPTDASG